MSTVHVETKFNKDRIEQQLVFKDCHSPIGMIDNVAVQVVNLQEQGVREALIKLGWTPPDEGAEKMTSERLTQLIKMIHKDLKMRSDEEGRTPISHFIWVMIQAEVDYDLEE
jgi:hypothetical protein